MVYDDDGVHTPFERPPLDPAEPEPHAEPDASTEPRSLRELWRGLDRAGRMRALALVCFVLAVVALTIGLTVAIFS